ncbi:probable microtubule-binding protein TANGLED [Argentina anserina]|uniref:probable microtubule-binding protein TANGLED n=1 Tax=Argentina anserina TaxID=57926 RepID=UPI0021762A32|nr:probable microtubule-binding protein TANGLED [Potentilla anserina]
MVAKTPPKQRKMVAPLNPALLRETVKKVDRCMARLQELQYTVTGGTKVISGVSLSPRSTRGYMRTSLRCKQESVRIKSLTPRKSPVGKFPAGKSPAKSAGEWQRMSLPAMLLSETVGEILHSSQFAREIVASVPKKTILEDPKTPMSQQRKQRPPPENRARRKREKRDKAQSNRSESGLPELQRARSRINFKVSPPKKREIEKENTRYLANRVSPKNRPWAKKSVLFPNPLFLATDTSPPQEKKFYRTRSPMIGRSSTNNTSPPQEKKFYRTRSPIIGRSSTNSTKPHQQIQTPHKFLIKSPASASKFQVKIKSPPLISSLSPTKAKKSPKKSAVSKLRRSFSPSRLATRLVSLSPLKSRKSVQKSEGLIMPGLKQRPTSSMPLGISARRN